MPDGNYRSISGLLYDTKSKVYYAGGFNHTYTFQFSRLYIQMVEQPDPLTEQEVRHVNMDLVHQTRVETLLQDTGGADNHILIACGLLCLTNCTFHAISDKGER